MICGRVVDQVITEPLKVDKGNKLNSSNDCDFRDKVFFALYKS